MTNRPAPALLKWPFILADVALLIACAWVITIALPSKAYSIVAIAIVGWMFGAWICVLPWLKEFQAECKLSESENLTSALEQIKKLEEVGARVQAATGTWQSAQDAAMRVTASAKEIEEKIRTDAKEFMEFAERINNDEKQHLRLEVEKLRRNEGEWLQVAARMLDHTFAITVAAHRSGQPNLAAQMNNFQNACRDAARRVGLVPFHPNAGDAYDERSQQLEDANAKPEEGAVVSDILATGYTFQGQLLRKALVRVSGAQQPEANQPQQEEQAAPVPAPEPIATEEQTAVAEQAEETHQQHEHEREQPTEPSNQWERLEHSFEQQNEPEADAAVVAEQADSAPEHPSHQEEEHLSHTHTIHERVHETPVAPSSYDYPDEPRSNEVAADNIAERGSPSPGEEERVEVSTEVTDELPAEEGDKPRRRQRKPDPQTSLPF